MRPHCPLAVASYTKAAAGQPRRRSLVLLSVVLALLSVRLGGYGTAATPRVTTIGIARHARPLEVPRSFFGLSTEYWTLPVDERHSTLYGRVISLLRVPGDGPFVLRVGGDSSDYTVYDPDRARYPRWAFDLTPSMIRRTVRLLRQLHLKVILDLNLITATPARLEQAVAEAQRLAPPAVSLVTRSATSLTCTTGRSGSKRRAMGSRTACPLRSRRAATPRTTTLMPRVSRE